MKQRLLDNQIIDSGIIKLTIKQYSRVFGVSDTTTRTRVREEQVRAYKQNNKWLIEVDKNEVPNPVDSSDNQFINESDTLTRLLEAKEEQIAQLEASVKHLRVSLDQANERSSRQDAIIMKQTLMIPVRSASIWHKLKGLFGGVQADA